MTIGLSTYSLVRALRSGTITVQQMLPWMAQRGAQHVEVVPIGFTLTNELAQALREGAQEYGLTISNYATHGEFLTATEGAYELEIERMKAEVDLAHALGVRRMRHDVAWRPAAESSIQAFDAGLPRLVEACQRIADYAHSFGIVTSVENHGYFLQHSDRVLRLLHAVDRPNFKMTIDIGNFLCVDEDPLAAVRKCLPYASMVHLKDFYIRRQRVSPGKNFFATAGGNYLRGAILGEGDMPMRDILYAVLQSGYTGDMSVEFEGIEDAFSGAEDSLLHALALWDEVRH